MTMTKGWKKTQAFLPNLQPYSCAVLRGCEVDKSTRAEGQVLGFGQHLGFGHRVLMAGGDTNPGLPGRFQKQIWGVLSLTWLHLACAAQKEKDTSLSDIE